MAKITGEICDNREIHGKIVNGEIMGSTVKSEHGSKAAIVNIALKKYYLQFRQKKNKTKSN